MMNELKKIKIPKRIRVVLLLTIIIFIFFKGRSFLFDIDYKTKYDQIFTS